MGVTSSNKEVNATQIECGGRFDVTLALTAEPDITENPTDIVLVLDRSGSMAGTPLESLKAGAKRFVEILDTSTGGNPGEIGGGSRIGIVSFATEATQDTGLITSVAQLDAAIDALSADGQTNHSAAFEEATDLLTPAGTNARVIVMFTDGFTTVGGDPTPIATAAKAQGITIYLIGLSGTGGIDEDALEAWASSPASAYVIITPDDAELEEIFEDLAENISRPGATDIVITDRIADCFRIVSLSAPTEGSASLVDANTVRWQIAELGVNASEGAALTFTVEHVGECSGEVEVNDSITYTDNENNAVTFPSPVITVDCGVIVLPEDCPEPVDAEIVGCNDSIVIDAGDLQLESQGRIVQVDVTLRNVCPNKRVALAVLLNEVDEEGEEYKRGLKTMTIPAHTFDSCRDVVVRCIKFILPEDISVSGAADSTCPERNVRARFFSHYIDHDFDCCPLLD